MPSSFLNSFRRWLLSNTAIPNECVKLKLPRAWEPLDSSQAVFINIGKEAQLCFRNGNKDRLEKNRNDQEKNWF